MYDIITISTIIFLLIFLVIMYQFVKDLKGALKQIKYEETYSESLESALIKWNKGVK